MECVKQIGQIVELFSTNQYFTYHSSEGGRSYLTPSTVYEREVNNNTNKILEIWINNTIFIIEGVNRIYYTCVRMEDVPYVRLEFDVSTNDGFEGTLQTLYIPYFSIVELKVYNGPILLGEYMLPPATSDEEHE